MRFAVIGLGNFGSHLAQTLAKSGAEVLAIDKDLVLIEQFKHEVTRAVSLDTTVQNNLKMASLTDMDAVIVTIGEHSVEASIMTTALIAGLGVEWLIARSTSSLHGRILKLVGAHEVINPEQFVAQKLVRRITQPNVLELAAISDDGYSMSDITAPPSFYGKTLAELELRKKYGLNVIAIKQRKRKLLPDGTEQLQEKVNHNPGPDDKIQENDIISCIGKREQIDKVASMKR